ncbi:MAG TPA: S1/P1 nuclease [Longimicrobiales bacterium]
MRTRTSIVALVALGTLPAPAHAWDQVGHRVIARIAWESMSPATRAKAVALLLAAPQDSELPALLPADGRPLAERERELFDAAAFWADRIRDRERPSHRYHEPTWHYVNFFWLQETPGGPAVELDRPLTGELLTQLRHVSGTVGDRARPAGQRGLDLAWLLHLVGDLHQPLHSSARVTAADPDGDRGGNAFGLGEHGNLHSFWDGVLRERFPREEGETDAAYIGRIAAALMREYPRAGFDAELAEPIDFEAWAREGLAVAQHAGYPAYLERDAPPPARYMDEVYAAAAPRIALAGYRLAALLEALLAR